MKNCTSTTGKQERRSPDDYHGFRGLEVSSVLLLSPERLHSVLGHEHLI